MPTYKLMNYFLTARLSAYDSYMLYQPVQTVQNAVPTTQVKRYHMIGDCGRKSNSVCILNQGTGQS